MDYARAVRYVRANAEKYGVDEDKIAGAVFSMVELYSQQKEIPLLGILMQVKLLMIMSRMNWMQYLRI